MGAPFTGLLIDLFCITTLGVTVLLLYLLGAPYERGFFCDDDSIRYPVVDDTVSNVVMVAAGLGIPVLMMSLVEAVTQYVERRSDDRPQPVSLFGKQLPTAVSPWIRAVVIFFFGAGINQVVVDIGKFTIGRLRPHFLAACLPDIDCDAKSQDPHEYIDDYECTSMDESVVREARLSFPSGHSALAFYSATFSILYLESTFTWQGSRLLRHTLQLLLLLGAWFTALSRISDYMHHWGDVLAGIAIGVISAAFTVVFVSDFYRSHWNVDAVELTSVQASRGDGRQTFKEDCCSYEDCCW